MLSGARFVAALPDTRLWARILLIAAAFVSVGANIAVIVLVSVSAEIYECRHCGEEFVPALSAYVLAPHTFTRRRLKCPRCGKKDWHKSKLR